MPQNGGNWTFPYNSIENITSSILCSDFQTINYHQILYLVLSNRPNQLDFWPNSKQITVFKMQRNKSYTNRGASMMASSFISSCFYIYVIVKGKRWSFSQTWMKVVREPLPTQYDATFTHLFFLFLFFSSSSSFQSSNFNSLIFQLICGLKTA